MTAFSDIIANYIRTHLRKGDVLLWSELDFKNGKGPQDKYLLILSDCLDEDFFILVLPTSQKQYYFGAQAKRSKVDVVVIRKGETEIFESDTIIDFKNCKRIYVEKMIKAYDGKKLKKIGALPENTIQRINSLVEGAENLSPKVKKIILKI